MGRTSRNPAPGVECLPTRDPYRGHGGYHGQRGKGGLEQFTDDQGASIPAIRALHCSGNCDGRVVTESRVKHLEADGKSQFRSDLRLPGDDSDHSGLKVGFGLRTRR